MYFGVSLAVYEKAYTQELAWPLELCLGVLLLDGDDVTEHQHRIRTPRDCEESGQKQDHYVLTWEHKQKHKHHPTP